MGVESQLTMVMLLITNSNITTEREKSEKKVHGWTASTEFLKVVGTDGMLYFSESLIFQQRTDSKTQARAREQLLNTAKAPQR